MRRVPVTAITDTRKPKRKKLLSASMFFASLRAKKLAEVRERGKRWRLSKQNLKRRRVARRPHQNSFVRLFRTWIGGET